MPSLRMPLVRALALFLAAGVMLGCAPPVVMYRPLSTALRDADGLAVDMVLTNGERYVISGGTVRNDTLFAVRVGEHSDVNPSVVVPVSRIASLSLAEGGVTSPAAGLIGGLLGIGLGALLVIALIFGAAR